MKNRILIVGCVVLITGHLLGQVQEDLQWLIRDGKGKDSIIDAFRNKYLTTQVPNPFQFKGIAEATTPKENEYFAIFGDGSYSFVTQNSAEPLFANTSNIKYLYLTNKYEEDDLPQKVKLVSHSGSGSTFPSIPDKERFFNHSIVENKDLTLIFNPNNTVFDVNCRTNYKLCYDDNDIEFVKSNFYNSYNYINQNSGGSLSYSSKEFLSNGGSEKCIEITSTAYNQFLNFRPTFNTTGTPPSKVIFYIKCGTQSLELKDNGGKIDITDKFHDPNYVELKCVWQEGLKKYARYHVECYNDGTGPVSNLAISLTLPIKAKLIGPGSGNANVTINTWKAGNKSGCGIDAIKLTKIVTGRELAVKFNLCEPSVATPPCPNILEGLPTGSPPTHSQKAWFEFCVELDNSTILTADQLQPSAPMTTFGHNGNSIDYPIETYIDKAAFKPNNNTSGTFYRNPKKCACACKQIANSGFGGH